MAIDVLCLTVEKVIVHHIYKRTESHTAKEPLMGKDLLQLPQAALDAFQLRITESLSNKSHGIEMDIVETKTDSFFATAAEIMEFTDDKFISLSKEIAMKLAKAQTGRDLAESKLIVVYGVAGNASTPYIAVIKAELQDGFADNQKKGIDHIKDLFLTKTQRLYKIGFLHANAHSIQGQNGVYDKNKYKCYLFDHLLTNNETRSAAHYFYSIFLGMTISASDKKKTKDFFELTKLFINSADIKIEEKSNLLDSLRTELRSNKAIINIKAFADDYLAVNLNKEYLVFMKGKKFESNSFTKDNEYIATRLKQRQKMTLSNGVQVITPPDMLHKSVKILSEDSNGTTIYIDGKIITQE